MLVTLLLLAASCLVRAEVSLTDQVKKALKNELYPASTVVTGYQRPDVVPPKFAVADFRAGDSSLLAWSKVVSETLRYKIHYIPGVRLHMPAPYLMYQDAMEGAANENSLLVDSDHFKNLNRVLGIESILTGSVEKNDDGFLLSAEIIDIESVEKRFKKAWNFDSKDLPVVLIEVCEWVYMSLGVQLTDEEHAYIKKRTSHDDKVVDDLVSLFNQFQNLKDPERRDKINELQKMHPDFVPLAIYALRNRAYARNLDDAYKNLELYENFRTHFRKNAGVEMESLRMMEIETLPKHKVAERLMGMKNIVKDNPQDPALMLVLADALVANGNTLEGISLLIEATERWPFNYRIWWSLGWALNRHSWQVRGHSMWRDVPELAKKQFSDLASLASLAIDRALEININSARLWNLKISTTGSVNGYSEDLMAFFEKAVRLAPTDRELYGNALNFAEDKWHGNASARRHIIETAIKNNPDERWPLDMKVQHSADFEITSELMKIGEADIKTIINHPYLWKLLVLVIVVLWLVYSMGRRAAQNKPVRMFEDEFRGSGYRDPNYRERE